MGPQRADHDAHPGVEWGWEFTLPMDIWNALKHRFMVDVQLRLYGEVYHAHKLLLCLRSLPLAQLLEQQPRHAAVVDIDCLFEDMSSIEKGSLSRAFHAVLEFISTDWLAELPLQETVLVCHLAKTLNIAFLFSMASWRLLQMPESEEAWPLVANTLFVPRDSDFARMLLEHTPDSNAPLPFDRCLEVAQTKLPRIIRSPLLPTLRFEVMKALLECDFAECTLSPDHLEHLLLQSAIAWSLHYPQDAPHILGLVKMPLLPAGALEAELQGIDLPIPQELINEGAQAPTPPLTPALAAASGAAATTPGTVLWRHVARKTKRAPDRRGAPGEDHPETSPGRLQGPSGRGRRSDRSYQEDVSRKVVFTPEKQREREDRSRSRSESELSRQERAMMNISNLAASDVGSKVSVPESILQNDGRPPTRYHQYRHLLRASPTVNLSTMSWECSLRPGEKAKELATWHSPAATVRGPSSK